MCPFLAVEPIRGQRVSEWQTRTEKREHAQVIERGSEGRALYKRSEGDSRVFRIEQNSRNQAARQHKEQIDAWPSKFDCAAVDRIDQAVRVDPEQSEVECNHHRNGDAMEAAQFWNVPGGRSIGRCRHLGCHRS